MLEKRRKVSDSVWNHREPLEIVGQGQKSLGNRWKPSETVENLRTPSENVRKKGKNGMNRSRSWSLEPSLGGNCSARLSAQFWPIFGKHFEENRGNILFGFFV